MPFLLRVYTLRAESYSFVSNKSKHACVAVESVGVTGTYRLGCTRNQVRTRLYDGKESFRLHGGAICHAV
jgi:hypothetical protein